MPTGNENVSAASGPSRQLKPLLSKPGRITRQDSKTSKKTALHSTDGRKRRTRAGKSRRRNWKPLCAGRATSHIAMSQDTRRVDPSVMPGARPAPSPGFIEPCRPTLREGAPSDGRWIHEIKFDGYRAQAHLRNGQPTIYTRAGYDWTLRFQTIADALATLPANDLIPDGEAVVADSRGIPDFGLLHTALAAGRQDRLLYYHIRS